MLAVETNYFLENLEADLRLSHTTVRSDISDFVTRVFKTHSNIRNYNDRKQESCS